MNHIEEGIYNASKELRIGCVKDGEKAEVTITEAGCGCSCSNCESNVRYLNFVLPRDPKGLDGLNGLDNYQLAVMNGFIGSLDDFFASFKGEDGEKGDTGKDGTNGKDGTDGTSLTAISFTKDANGEIIGGTATLSDDSTIEISITTETVSE